MNHDQLAPLIAFDIEATGLKSDFGHVLAVGFKPLGGTTKVLSVLDYPKEFKKRPWDDTRLLEDVFDVLSLAGGFITYYGTGYDLPFLQSRMLAAGIGVLPPVSHVDVYKIAKQWFPLHSRRLGSVGQFLGCKAEKTPLDPGVWTRAQYGSRADIKYIIDHCEADVDLLEEVYLKIRGLDQRHPVRTRLPIGQACNRCGAPRKMLQMRGPAYTRGVVWQRYQCMARTNGIPCGAWGRVRIAEKDVA